MSITTRTNLATRASAAAVTNYAAVAGTGGTAALTNQAGVGASGNSFNRVTWSAATTAVSGGGTYTEPSGIAPSQAHAFTIYVRSSIAQRVQPKIDFRNASNAIVNTVNGSAVVLVANAWTPITITGVSGAAVTNAVLSVLAVTGTGGVVWPVNATLDMDAVLIELGSTFKAYFDGSYVSAGGKVYAFTGATDASTSTEKTYVPAIQLDGYTDMAPCPRTGITIADLAPSDHVVSVWRTADGERTSVRSARDIAVVGSTFLTDYETPLGRSVQYDIEITSGINSGSTVAPASVTINAPDGCIQDPLIPASSVAVNIDERDGTGQTTMMAASVTKLEYHAATSLIQILGSKKPVALLGDVMAAQNIPFQFLTDAAEDSTNLRELLKGTPLLLVRPLPSWGDSLPGLFYTVSPQYTELPMPEMEVTWWELTGNTVASPRLNVLVPIWTYGDVEQLENGLTYQHRQDIFASKTYLDELKSPTGV